MDRHDYELNLLKKLTNCHKKVLPIDAEGKFVMVDAAHLKEIE